jgi:CBS domain containing-hemolysin-like protein
MNPPPANLVLAVLFTLGVSALCSILEAMILSTTAAEIEGFKRKKPKAGSQLERFKKEMEETTSAILTLNTIANTLGATLVGGIASEIYGEDRLLWFSVGLTVGILIFSEILPKNAGVIYRRSLQPVLVPILAGVRFLMAPLSKLCKVTVNFVIQKKPQEAEAEDEIILLAEKSAKEGTLSNSERDMIFNALSLDDIAVGDIMTPRTVVLALEQTETVGDVFMAHKNNIPFGRIPVFSENIDNIVGIVRRRELLSAMAADEPDRKVIEFQQEPVFVPEVGTVAEALKTLQSKNQQLGVVVDEFGSTVGVVAMEDIFEHILGQEIFEKDDPAEDMREFARQKHDAKSNGNDNS